MKALSPSLKTFVWIVDLLTTVIHFYSEVLVAKPVLQIGAIADSGGGKLVSNYWDDYNAARERFVGFVGEYKEFVSKVNGEFGQVRRRAGIAGKVQNSYTVTISKGQRNSDCPTYPTGTCR